MGGLGPVGTGCITSVSSQWTGAIRLGPRAMQISRNISCLAPRLPHPTPMLSNSQRCCCSRVCHDLISPVGAIVNGLEVLDDDPKPEDREFALELIRKSAKTASARLQFCLSGVRCGRARLARRSISGDAQNMARGHLEDSRTTISWNLPRLLFAEEPGQGCS